MNLGRFLRIFQEDLGSAESQKEGFRNEKEGLQRKSIEADTQQVQGDLQNLRYDSVK